MKKRILSLVLTVAMLVSVIAVVGVSASAQGCYTYDWDLGSGLPQLYRVRCGCTSTYTCIYCRNYYNRLNCTRYWDSSTSGRIYPCRNDDTYFTATVGAYGKVARGSTVGDTYYTTVSDYTDWANIEVGPAAINGKGVSYTIQRADRHYLCRDYGLVNGSTGSFWLEDGRNVFKVTATVDTKPEETLNGSVVLPKSVEVEVGKIAEVTASLTGNLPSGGSWYWEFVDGDKCFNFDNGSVNPVTIAGEEAGTATIKVTYYVNGQYFYSDVCTVSVKAAATEPEKPVEPEHTLELKAPDKNNDTKSLNVKLYYDGELVPPSGYSITVDPQPAKCIVNGNNDGYWFSFEGHKDFDSIKSVKVSVNYEGKYTDLNYDFVSEDPTKSGPAPLTLEGTPAVELPVIGNPVETESDVVENVLHGIPGQKPGAPEAPKTNVYTFYVVIDKDYEKTLPTYTIKTECSVGGKVSNSDVTVRRGDDATIKFTANAGYAVSSVVVDGVEQGAITSYTFEDVVKNHTVKVTFMPVEIIPEAPVAFSDIPTTHWAYTYIQSLVNAGIINGYEDGTFKPDNTVTWGEALKLVLRVAGYSEQTAPAGEYWATGYMNLAISQGILADVVDLRAPIDRLSMAQLAAKALELSAPTVASPFADCSNAAVVALYEAGIITGSNVAGSTVYNPDSSLTRAEFAAIIYRMRELG